MIGELVKKLTNEERHALEQRIERQQGHIYPFIHAFLENPDISKEEIEQKFNLNSNTYFKNLTLAKEEIFDVIKQQLKNSYDDLILCTMLYRRGLEVYASKLRLKLEEEYEKNGWWSVLNEVYNAEILVQYSKCDIEGIRKTRSKIVDNMERLLAYTRIDKDIVVEMAILEKGEIPEDELQLKEAGITQLFHRAKKVGHHIPVFNALHCHYLLHTQYTANRVKARQTVEEIAHFLDLYKESMIPLTRNVAILNMMSFYVAFEQEKEPSVFFKDVEKAIGKHGLLFDTQAIMNFCSYYFLLNDPVKFDYYHKRFSILPKDRSYGYQTAYINALRAYLAKDSKAFYEHQNCFYQMGNSRDYNEFNLQLRYLENILLLIDGDLALAQDKIDATQKFIRRHFSRARIELEKINMDLLRASLRKQEIPRPLSAVYRITELIRRDLKGINS